MIISYTELCELVEQGVISNVKPEQIQPASIDLTLAPSFKREEVRGMIDEEIVLFYPLQPNEFILAATQQVFNLPNDICGVYYMNSSMARVGLQHALATFCDPGWHNSVLTLELKNQNRCTPINLYPNQKIGQMVFHRIKPVPEDRSYAKIGRYNNDLKVQGVKCLKQKN